MGESFKKARTVFVKRVALSGPILELLSPSLGLI